MPSAILVNSTAPRSFEFRIAMDTKLNQDVGGREFTLQELLEIFRRYKWLVLIFTVTCAALSLATAYMLPKRYEATVVVSPVSSTSGGEQMSGLSSLASQFGGLASLAGISVTGDSKKAESVAVLQSDAIAGRFIESQNLRLVLYANKWDANSNRWKDPAHAPSLWKSTVLFKKLLLVSQDTKTGLVTLKIKWKNSVQAADWANGLVKMTNDYLRGQAIAQSERNIAYLNDQAAKTNIVEARLAIYSIMEAELNKLMLARGSEEYAFKVLDPAVAPEKAAFPDPVNWFLFGLFGGLFVVVSWVLLRSSDGWHTSG